MHRDQACMTSISHDNAEWYINIITYLRHRPLDLLTRYRKIPITVQRSLHTIASIPGRVFAFITVRRTTGPGTSCLRMRQIFIVYLWSAKIFNKSIMEICTQKMHRVSTQKMHIGSCFTKAWGVASCAAAQLQ